MGVQTYHGIEQAVDIVALARKRPATRLRSIRYWMNSTRITDERDGAKSATRTEQGAWEVWQWVPNAIIYNTNTVQLISSVGVGTPIGSFNACTGRRCVISSALGGSAANSFYVYVTHMKSSFSGESVCERVLSQRRSANYSRRCGDTATAANPNPSILYLGRFNLSGSAIISDGCWTFRFGYYPDDVGGAAAVDPDLPSS